MSESAPSAVDARHAWTLLARRDPPKRPAAARVADFLEIYGRYDEATAREQASRCIVCAEPSCVTGCPLASPISEWMALTAAGEFGAAADLLQLTSCIPEVSARTCPSDKLCEPMCLLDGRAEPVSIWAVEQFLHHYTFDRNRTTPDAPPNGRSVAVIGVNAGGLACADELVRMGFRVTIVNASASSDDAWLGGIPAFRIERGLVQRRIEDLRQRGVEFRPEAAGETRSLDVLRSNHDAVYLAFAPRVPRGLNVPGASLRGVVQALPFILLKNGDAPPQFPPLDLHGRRIAVIGGGDTALDCARTAVRCGAAETVCVYRRDAANMPGGRRSYENAVEEGVRFIFESAPIEVLGTDAGTVAGLKLVRTQPDGIERDGRRSFVPQPETEFTLAADVVFLALGFDRVAAAADSPLRQLATDDQGQIVVDASMMSSVGGVFAGGDLVHGPAAPINAVRDARRAAAGIQAYVARAAGKSRGEHVQ